MPDARIPLFRFYELSQILVALLRNYLESRWLSSAYSFLDSSTGFVSVLSVALPIFPPFRIDSIALKS
jgi:hypothetical protein